MAQDHAKAGKSCQSRLFAFSYSQRSVLSVADHLNGLHLLSVPCNTLARVALTCTTRHGMAHGSWLISARHLRFGIDLSFEAARLLGRLAGWLLGWSPWSWPGVCLPRFVRHWYALNCFAIFPDIPNPVKYKRTNERTWFVHINLLFNLIELWIRLLLSCGAAEV